MEERKRYGVIFPEGTYRRYRSQAAKEGLSIGEWIVKQVEGKMEPGRKAIEPDKIKVTPTTGAPKLSKGLGQLPGGEAPKDPYRDFRPAPKPK